MTAGEIANPPRPRGRAAGFVLLAVLWAMALLSLVAARIAGGGGTETRIAAGLRAASQASAALEGAVWQSAFDLIGGRIAADGTHHGMRIGSALADVAITDENTRLNPNTASPEILVALLRAAGARQGQALRAAQAMLDWRTGGDRSSAIGGKLAQYRIAGRALGPPGAPFRSVGEVGLVLGITPDLFAAVAPHLSVHQEGIVDPRMADPLVRAAYAQAGYVPQAAGGLQGSGLRVVAVAVRAVIPGGAQAGGRAVLRIDPASPGAPVLLVSWSDSPDQHP